MELERWPNPGARWNMLWHRGRAANQQCHRGGWILGGPQEPQGLPRGPKLLFKTASQAYQPPVPVSCMFTSLASSQGQSKVNPRQSLQIWHHSMKSTKLFLPMTHQVFDSKLEVFYLHHEKHLQRTHTLCISQKAPDQWLGVWNTNYMRHGFKTSQELRMLSPSLFIQRSQSNCYIVVLNCQQCNQCTKCQVSGHKNCRQKWSPKMVIKNCHQKWSSKIVIKTVIKKLR